MTHGRSGRTAETTVRPREPINIGIVINATFNSGNEVHFYLGDLRVR
jgi:hypothetical protein